MRSLKGNWVHSGRFTSSCRTVCLLGVSLFSLSLLSGCQNSETDLKRSDQQSMSVQLSSNTPQACAADASSACGQTEEQDSLSADLADFESMDFDEAVEFFRTGQSGLLYFGFPDCPWCQEVIPLLHEAAGEDVAVHYIRTRDENRSRLYTDEQKEQIVPYLKDYMSENDEGELTLYVPLVVAVEHGQVTDGHQGTVEGHDAHERTMTEEEKEQVTDELQRIVGEVRASSAS